MMSLAGNVNNEDSSAIISSYKLFQGIELICYDMKQKQYIEPETNGPKHLYIDYCFDGRIEYKDSGKFHYLSDGDLALSQRDIFEGSRYYPLGHFKGISIKLDLNSAPSDMSVFFDGINVKPEELCNKFCKEKGFYVIRENQGVKSIFAGYRNIPKGMREGFFRLKVLELMLFLNNTEPQKTMIEANPIGRVRLAKDAGTYMSERMDQKITVNELAAHFHVSQTQLKNCFKAVYGMSVHAYIREQKMKAAAVMLKETDVPVLEIAGKYGFDNGSKFAKAFKDVMGTTPKVYRNIKNA